jgi:hypothetical protein
MKKLVGRIMFLQGPDRQLSTHDVPVHSLFRGTEK